MNAAVLIERLERAGAKLRSRSNELMMDPDQLSIMFSGHMIARGIEIVGSAKVGDKGAAVHKQVVTYLDILEMTIDPLDRAINRVEQELKAMAEREKVKR